MTIPIDQILTVKRVYYQLPNAKTQTQREKELYQNQFEIILKGKETKVMQRNESMPVYATLDLTYQAMLLDL